MRKLIRITHTYEGDNGLGEGGREEHTIADKVVVGNNIKEAVDSYFQSYRSQRTKKRLWCGEASSCAIIAQEVVVPGYTIVLEQKDVS
jgi:hypothetical protein